MNEPKIGIRLLEKLTSLHIKISDRAFKQGHKQGMNFAIKRLCEIGYGSVAEELVSSLTNCPVFGSPEENQEVKEG